MPRRSSSAASTARRSLARRLSVVRYHLTFVLRYPARRVHSMALWVIRPPEHQRLEEVERHGMRLRVTSLVLRELPAELLLSDARTACFAAGADAGQLSDDDLCDAIVKRAACKKRLPTSDSAHSCGERSRSRGRASGAHRR
jgi:hypothetical protein